ncbi:hypothetical protein [Filimonas effusa]|uniref:HEAT repeat domain-containing protein n=1 Tax=Filimonas effusa TaxID=2508721 RepID=A0A4Q1DAC7_9BACT|nr:hypothetical protein [Filimonas effusa]RXK86341.1 hypothetical protein ESB13_05930 [Filimonas effusa]
MSSLLNRAALLVKDFEKADVLDHAAKAAASPSYFAALVRYLQDKDKVVATRASWCLNWAARRNPSYVQPHVGVLAELLQQPAAPAAVVRNCASILQDVSIPEVYQGIVMNTCFELVTNPATPIAIKAFSLTILDHLSHEYPEIKPELQLIIETQLEKETAAFRSRAKKILKRLQR